MLARLMIFSKILDTSIADDNCSTKSDMLQLLMMIYLSLISFLAIATEKFMFEDIR